MTPDEFLTGAAALVGQERGTLRRIARFLGVSEKTVQAISGGHRPVPAAYASRLRQALAEADKAGACVPYLSPRLERVVDAATRAGWPQEQVYAAIAAWAALRLSGAR